MNGTKKRYVVCLRHLLPTCGRIFLTENCSSGIWRYFPQEPFSLPTMEKELGKPYRA